ncbi:MAG: glycosyltransferase WbuB [Burkholderiales bacterium 68-10]|nr:MAG: glycosyltransferase WbuB [Burkholderiales bacterium 68-10]
MKHVWILNHYAQEPGGAGGTRHFHLAEHLQAHGWQGTIIAASVDHASGQQRLAAHQAQRLDTLQGVPFLWINTPGYRGNGGGRVRNMLAYTWAALRRRTTAGLPRPDVVIGSSVHPFAAVAGALLARRYKVPFVFEVRDLWPQTLVDMGRLRDDAPATWVLRRLERWLYRRAARTVVLLPQAWQYIVPLGIAKERVVWIPNGVDLSLFPRAAPATQSQDGVFTLMYFGAHGQANGLDNVLQAMARLRQMPAGQHIRLRLIGDGPLKPALVAQAEALGLRNVVFEPPVPKAQIPALAAQADAFVIAVLDLPGLYRFGISMNKLFDYLAAERPTVMASSASNNPIAEAGAGLTVAPGQPQALAEAIAQIAAMPLAERQRMGRAGREYVEQNHGFDQLAGRLAAVLDAVCAEQRR